MSPFITISQHNQGALQTIQRQEVHLEIDKNEEIKLEYPDQRNNDLLNAFDIDDEYINLSD